MVPPLTNSSTNICVMNTLEQKNISIIHFWPSYTLLLLSPLLPKEGILSRMLEPYLEPGGTLTSFLGNKKILISWHFYTQRNTVDQCARTDNGWLMSSEIYNGNKTFVIIFLKVNKEHSSLLTITYSIPCILDFT